MNSCAWHLSAFKTTWPYTKLESNSIGICYPSVPGIPGIHWEINNKKWLKWSILRRNKHFSGSLIVEGRGAIVQLQWRRIVAGRAWIVFVHDPQSLAHAIACAGFICVCHMPPPGFCGTHHLKEGPQAFIFDMLSHSLSTQFRQETWPNMSRNQPFIKRKWVTERIDRERWLERRYR